MAQAETRAAHATRSATAVRPPSVLVILVAKDGAAWLRRCLLSLSRQTYPRLRVFAVDNGSTDGSADLLEAALGAARVVRLPDSIGFSEAVAHALRADAAADADYVLLLHDDTVLAPTAVERMVQAATRIEGVGIIGPKVLDWVEPRLLRDVGMSADRFGYPYSPLEDDEIDQGQYDRVREVMFVSSCAMLVAREVLDRVGGLDDRLVSHHQDLDFCWRARLAGFRVLMTPAAEARHRAAAAHGERTGAPAPDRGRYRTERDALASTLKNYGWTSLAWVLPLYLATGLAKVAVLVLTRRFEEAYQVAAAWGWNVAHLPGTLRRRLRVQAVRAVPDRRIRRFMAPAGDRLRRWAGLVRRAVLPPAEGGGLDEDEEPPTVPFRVSAGRFAVAHPVAMAWMAAAVLGLIAFRNVLGASALAGGALGWFPASPSGFFREFVSGLRSTGLGGGQPASPALGIMGLGSVLTLGNPLLLQKLLLAALPALGAVAAYRALRGFAVGTAASVVAAAAYALSPLTLWAVGEGRLGALVLVAGLPWLAVKLGRSVARGEARWTRWAAGTGLGLAVLASFYPGAALAAAVVTVATLILPPLPGSRGRGAARIGAAAVAAALLAFPVVLNVVASGGEGLAEHLGPASFARLTRLSVAAGPGGWWVAFFLPAAAALALVFVPGHAARPAAWATLCAVSSLELAWLSAANRLPDWAANPVAYEAVAAFGYVVLIGLALGALLTGVAEYAFGHRQVGAGAMALLLGVGLLGQVYETAKGGWRIGEAEDVLPQAHPLVARAAGEPYRILWLGAWGGGPLAAAGGTADGRLAAGAASVRYAVTDQAGASALDVGRPAAGPGYERLERALADVLTGDTHHGGALLAPFGIRFVVGDPRDLPRPAARILSSQIDLDVVPAGDLTVLEVARPAPLAGVLRAASWEAAARQRSAGPPASLPPPRAAPFRRRGPVLSAADVSRRASLVLLSEQYEPSWRMRVGGRETPAFRAFGWAVGFPAPPGAKEIEVRFGGQRTRDAMVVLLAALWAGALWSTRRRVGDA